METKQFETALRLFHKLYGQPDIDFVVADGLLFKLVTHPFDATFIDVMRSWPAEVQALFIAKVTSLAANDFRWSPSMTGGSIEDTRFCEKVNRVYELLADAGLIGS